MSTVNDTDLLLVERDGTQYKITFDEMSTINDDDLLLVERNGVQHQLAAVDLDLSSGSIASPVEVLTPDDGAGVGGAITFQPVSEPIVSGPRREQYYGTQSISTQITNVSNVNYSSVSSNGAGTTILTPDHYNVYGITYQTDWGWTRGFTPTGARYFKDSLWTGSKFVVITEESPYVYTSPDGITWTAASDAKSGNWQKIIRNDQTGRLLVSKGQNDPTNRYMYSDDDGDTWTYSSGVVEGPIGEYTAYGNGVFTTAPNYNKHGEWSNDGVNWTQANIDSLDSYRIWTGMDYDPNTGIFLIMGYRNSSSYSTRHAWARSSDGKSWDTYYTYVASSYEAANTFKGLKWVNDRFLVGGTYWANYLWQIRDGYTIEAVGYMTTHPNDSGYRFPHNYCWTGRNYFVHSHSSGEYFYYSNGSSLSFARADRATFGNTNYADNRYIYEYYDVAGTDVHRTSDDSIVPNATFAEFLGGSGQELGTTDTKGIVVTGPTTFRLSYKWSGSYSYGFNVGDRIQRDREVTQYGPSPVDVEFTSQNNGTTAVTSTDATLSFRVWTLETRATALDPWTVVSVSEDYSPVASQDGATAWDQKPTLEPNTMYRVKVAYHSSNARTVESNYIEFTTGDS